MNGHSKPNLVILDQRLRSALAAFFLRRVGSRAEAEDLTQEVFARLASGSSEGPMSDAYIFQTAANLLRDRARRAKVRRSYRESRLLEEYLSVDPLDPFRIASAREDLAVVVQAIAQLPDKTRRIFTLYRIENVDKRTIAASFSISVRMVELHIRKALIALAASLEEEL